MFEAALDAGNSIAMIYTFAPSANGMEREFAETAEHKGSKATLNSIYAEGAMDALRNGDADTHNRLVAEVADRAGNADAILLAHFSTAQAAGAVREKTSIPVLSSPESAVQKIKRSIENPECG